MTISLALSLVDRDQKLKKLGRSPQSLKTALIGLVVIGGILALYGLSASGIIGKGPLSKIGIKGNCAILGTFGALEVVTFLVYVGKKTYFKNPYHDLVNSSDESSD